VYFWISTSLSLSLSLPIARNVPVSSMINDANGIESRRARAETMRLHDAMRCDAIQCDAIYLKVAGATGDRSNR